MKRSLRVSLLLLLLVPSALAAKVVGTAGADNLQVVSGGAARVAIVVSPEAGRWETKAAKNLRHYIARMAGPQPALMRDGDIAVPALVIGKAALRAQPSLAAELARVVQKNPLVQADAIVVKRIGDRVYLAGTNDESHYFAAAWLLQQWGCRWYMPTAFGEHVPKHRELAVGALDFAYAPPFEIRRYTITWNGDATGSEEFQHRNFMSGATMAGAAHVLENYTADLAPPGQSHFNVAFADPATAEHVAAKLEAEYAAGKDITLGIADGLYTSQDARDRALITEFDHAMLKPSLTDAMMTLYNNVARILRRKYPHSRSKIGGLAYANVTLPPRKVTAIEPKVVMWLAPIDVDPNHAMDDPRSPSRLGYRKVVERWSELLGGRLAIYDYDQGMLVWRDLPNPSHHVFARDVKHYRAAGVVGISTESRGAFATTFLNLFFRGQLMWEPETDVPAMLAEFYRNFYGPAAEPMARYWGSIFAAWEATAVTEHEHLAIPAIYTPALVDRLRGELNRAEAQMAAARGKMGDEALYDDRMRFTRLSFELIAGYVAMTSAGASDGDYGRAVRAGEKALATRLKLAELSPILTTRVVGPVAETAAGGAMWFPGEVQQWRQLAALVDGSKGRLVTRISRRWWFRREKPLPKGWTYPGQEGEGGSWSTRPSLEEPALSRGWQEVRSDLYLQAQGVRGPDGHGHLGHYWYRTTLKLNPGEARGKVRLMFPGLFNEAWLYVNGKPVAHRPYDEPWWRTDYRFEWDVDLTGHLRPGRNLIALRGFNPHHFGGMFRRPFLYRPT